MELRGLLKEYEWSLTARGKSRRTVDTYLESLNGYLEWSEAEGLPTEVSLISHRHIQGFLASLGLAGRSPGTVHNRFRALRTFFLWLEREEDLRSPMRRVEAPQLPETPVPVLVKDDIEALLRTCVGKGYADRRDLAILRLFVDSGVRAGEMAGMCVGDLDMGLGMVYITGKGSKPRSVPFGPETALAIARYLRLRKGHRMASLPDLWLGPRTGLSCTGLEKMVRRRAAAAGLKGRVYPHRFRHTFAHEWLVSGGGETDLMRLTGWKTREMLTRYGASAADERAVAAYRRLRG